MHNQTKQAARFIFGATLLLTCGAAMADPGSLILVASQVAAAALPEYALALTISGTVLAGMASSADTRRSVRSLAP